jgi:hypothetical protein
VAQSLTWQNKKKKKTTLLSSPTVFVILSILYSSDDQLAARGPDPARSLIYSGPRQVTGLVRLVKVSISA